MEFFIQTLNILKFLLFDHRYLIGHYGNLCISFDTGTIVRYVILAIDAFLTDISPFLSNNQELAFRQNHLFWISYLLVKRQLKICIEYRQGHRVNMFFWSNGCIFNRFPY